MTWVLALEIAGAWSLAASVVRLVDVLEQKKDRHSVGAEQRSRKAKSLT